MTSRHFVPFISAFLTLCFLTSCGKNRASDASSFPPLPPHLLAKYALYKDIHTSLQAHPTSLPDSNPRAYSPVNSSGFVHSQCDGVGFTSLCHFAGFCKAPSAAESSTEPGRWYRDAQHICYPTASASDISKDMLLMIMFDRFFAKDVAALQRIRTYGEAHNWVMGEPLSQIGRVYMTPPLQSTLRGAIKKLEGDLPEPVTTDFALGNVGSAAHLDVLHILFRGEIYGYITDAQKSLLQEQASRQPRNALFQYAYHLYEDNDFSFVYALLEDNSLYPSYKLPSSSERCEEYLWQRDEDTSATGDWSSCPHEGLVHSGTDFGVVLKLLSPSL